MRNVSVLVATALAVLLAVSCKKEPGPNCTKLKSCCDAVKADKQYAATSAWGLCDTYLGSMHTNDDLCLGTANDVRSDITKASKTPPAACAR